MEASKNNQKTESEMNLSFLAIRKSVGILGIALPIVLVLGTLVVGDCGHLKNSISSYYYTLTGNFLTGILCAVALFLFTYKGYKKVDDVTSTVAGLSAVGIAVFPTDPDTSPAYCAIISKLPNAFSNTAHFISATIFFVVLAGMSLFLFTKSDKKKEDRKAPKRNRNRVYRTCGIVMLIVLVLIPVLKIPAVERSVGAYQLEFGFETIALWAFGFSWLVKGETMWKD